MLKLKEDGYDGVARVGLGPFGEFFFLQSADAVKSVTLDQADAFPRRFSVPLFETLELDRGIVYEQGEQHRANKRRCVPSFENTRAMKTFLEAVQVGLDAEAPSPLPTLRPPSPSLPQVELDALSARWQRAGARDADGLRVDLYAEMRRLTLDVVLRVTFGLSDDGDGVNRDELSETIGAYLERIVATANEIPPLWQISPRLSGNYVAVVDELLPRLRALVGDAIAARRRLLDAATPAAAGDGDDDARRADPGGGAASRADLLSALVADPTLDDDAIRSILFDLVIAGSDTTASTLTAALYLLHEPRHASALARARAEARDARGARDVDLEGYRAALPYSTAVAREILRLYPPVPFIGRVATAEAVVAQTRLREGAVACWSPWFLGRDRAAWGADAGEFAPGRWLDDATTGGAPSTFSWLPFGAGPRGCLGTRLGLTEAVVGVTRLLDDFEFTFENDGALPVRYDLTLNLDGVARCRVRARQAAAEI